MTILHAAVSLSLFDVTALKVGAKLLLQITRTSCNIVFSLTITTTSDTCVLYTRKITGSVV